MNIAVKRTKLEKLSKEEKANIKKPSALLTFITSFMFFGGLFAIGFTILFPLLFFPFLALIDGWAFAWEAITAIPWDYIFLSCWILSGGAIGIAITLAGRK